MLPVIVVSQFEEKQEAYIQNLIKEHSIALYNQFYIRPEKKEISIEQIRELKKQLIHHRTEPYLFVLYSFDNASAEAQNAMLKTLEERSQQHMFLLLASQSDKLLPTIRSRSRIEVLDSKTAPVVDPKVTDLVESITTAKNPDFLANTMVSGIKAEQAPELIDAIILVLRTKLEHDSIKASSSIKEAMKLKSLLQNNNLNAQLCIDNLLLQIHKIYSTPI